MDIDKGVNTSDAIGKFRTVQPLRDLESNWAVDLAKNLEDYLLKICSGEISGDEEGPLSVNFAEAALLLQGSIQVYSRKVEYLYSLVLHALDFISEQSQEDQTEDTSAQRAECSSRPVRGGADDSFWGLDDIPVDAKNCIESANDRDATLNYFVKPPANLVVLEGDCLDASGDGGELENYLLATNYLYRDFILLDSCDAVAVDEFLDREVKASKWKNNVGGGSSGASKSRKSFLSPSRRSGGSGLKSSAKGDNTNLDQPPFFDHGIGFNEGLQPSASKIPDNTRHDVELDDGYSDRGSFDEEDENGDEVDPWKLLNPHEKGNLKVKAFKKVKSYIRDWVSSRKFSSLAKEFPLARLRGTISPELNEIWEKQRLASERKQDPQTPPFYEKLRQSLVRGRHESFGSFGDEKIDNEWDGYDGAGPDFEVPDFDVPDYMNEEPLHPEQHDDGASHFDIDETFGNEDLNSHTNLEDLCRSHLDSLLASISENEKQTAMAARVSKWKHRIEQSLEEQDSHPPFDIHEYGERVLDKLSQGRSVGSPVSFTDVVRGQGKHDVARTFSALLQLVNNGSVELEEGGTSDLTCYTAAKPFCVRLLGSNNRSPKVHLGSSRKRAKSPLAKGKENRQASFPPPANVISLSPRMGCKFSAKLGKVGGTRCTPDGKRRRRAKFSEQTSGR